MTLATPVLGVVFGFPKWESYSGLICEAFAYFRWVNGALAQSAKAPLIINMDEASVAFHLSGLVGTVLKTGPFTSLRPGDSV